jgi:Asp/Glu/hydantoin racemase
MPRSLGLIHTVVNLVPVFADLTQRHLPDWSVFSIVDESLLKNTIRSGELTTITMRRLAGHVWSAVDAGADAIMVTCSSVGPAVDATVPFCPVKLFRVDEAMADEAIDLGARIGVLATLSTTLGPTRDLIERRAARRAKPVSLSHSICEGAFEALQRGDRERHDQLIKEKLLDIAKTVDVVVLAQASMARVADGLPVGELSIPVLSSPELAVKRLCRDIAAAP